MKAQISVSSVPKQCSGRLAPSASEEEFREAVLKPGETLLSQGKQTLGAGTLWTLLCHYWGLLAHWCFAVVVLQLPSIVQLFVTPWTAAWQASFSFTIFWSLLKRMSIESVMSSSHLILCYLLLLLPSVLPRIRVFSNEVAVHIS